jgi:hypothetical protein
MFNDLLEFREMAPLLTSLPANYRRIQLRSNQMEERCREKGGGRVPQRSSGPSWGVACSQYMDVFFNTSKIYAFFLSIFMAILLHR